MAEETPEEKSIPQEFIEAVKRRLSHPVAGVFALVWILFNWRMLFFLAVSDRPAEARIDASLEYLNHWSGITFPTLLTFVYLALSPWLSEAVSWWNGKASERQSLREYQDALTQLRHRADIEMRANNSLQSFIKEQEEIKVRLEAAIERLAENKRALEAEIHALVSIESLQWDAFYKETRQTLNMLGPQAAYQKKIGPLKATLDRAFELK